MYTSGFVSIILAKANLCFCPPDNNDPPSPTLVSNLFSNPITKSYKFALIKALYNSFSLASFFPILKFSAIVVLNI